MEQLSKMMQQYLQIKSQHEDCLLFFRLGDFYEMFFEDAKIASEELELTLTGRNCGLKERAPMCGVPHHSYETYVARLIKKGYKVAICEQVEDPSKTKEIVKREVTRIITPGTVIEGIMLDESKNNYISSVYIASDKIGLCFADISTGDLQITEVPFESTMAALTRELAKFSPTEVISNQSLKSYKGVCTYVKDKLHASIDLFENEEYNIDEYTNAVCNHFNTGLTELGLLGKTSAVLALGKLLNYLNTTQKHSLKRITELFFYEEDQYMLLDISARKNLELTETMMSSSKKGSLLWVVDKTKTSMGKRLLKSYLEKPLVNASTIRRRLDAVEEIKNNSILLNELENQLKYVFDIERIITRVVCEAVSPRELLSLHTTLSQLPEIKRLISEFKTPYLKEIYKNIDTLEDVCKLIFDSINPEAPVSLKDGNVIKEGYNDVLDEFRSILKNVKQHLAKIEEREREATGIKNLRTGYNKVFGYFIEVTNSYKNLVPETYIRKQTLTNCERYINDELKDIENKILNADSKVAVLEAELYEDVRKKIALELVRIQKTASALSKLDVFCSFARVAVENNYVKPSINTNGVIDIINGRHPVVEAIMSSSLFVPNDTILDMGENRISIITGPNMAGKSTYMRQTAIIVLLAHIGSFVPATEADISITDAIFTRVGASDDLSTGQSTFMVEMNEVSDILKKATKNSLIILDEVGRGTSTFDGMSIAKAVLEHIAAKEQIGAKCMFATHYHELSEMEKQIQGVKNYNVAVKKNGEDIVFLRKIIRGHADESYGIEVAKLADLPESVIRRAREILDGLENGDMGGIRETKFEQTTLSQNMPLSSKEKDTIQKIKDISIDALTPIEALNMIYKLKENLK